MALARCGLEVSGTSPETPANKAIARGCPRGRPKRGIQPLWHSIPAGTRCTTRLSGSSGINFRFTHRFPVPSISRPRTTGRPRLGMIIFLVIIFGPWLAPHGSNNRASTLGIHFPWIHFRTPPGANSHFPCSQFPGPRPSATLAVAVAVFRRRFAMFGLRWPRPRLIGRRGPRAGPPPRVPAKASNRQGPGVFTWRGQT